VSIEPVYLWLKLLHLAAVVVFLGNIYTGLFWKAIADRTRDPRIMAHTLDGIIRSDRWFTIPGVLVIVIGGIGAGVAGNLQLLRVGWIVWSIVLFTLSGVVFGVRLVPLQRQLRDLARRGETGGGLGLDWGRYGRLSLAWELWGAFALAAPVVAMGLMVLKPVQ
jgi:uncharacterized membrane protein